MNRWFNTAGPCQADRHYMLSPTERLPNLERLIAQQGYFVIHAPRQVGKTTAMLALAKQLTASGQYCAVMVSAEVGAGFPDDPTAAEKAMLEEWLLAIQFYLPPELHPTDWPTPKSDQSLNSALQAWAQECSRPIVLFIDEIDALENNVLISVLRQIRSGYPRRPQGFPLSIALIGLRDVRDYKVASGGSGRLNTASPFNIKVKSLTLRNFTAEEVNHLYQQHTEATGQQFTSEAIQLAFELTQGQPWLVNALAKEAVEELVPDLSQPIGLETIHRAKEILIQRQDTHLDSLAERLREDRVRAVIEPMLAGQELGMVPNDDRQYLVDLGLLVRHPAGGLTLANPIYREVLPRVLASGPQDSLPIIQPSWLTPSGQLDTGQLLEAVLDFWRQHGEPLLRSAPYAEIAPHLVLMAFLHRVANGGGSLEREYAIGTGRMDLCLRYGDVTLGMELKVWRDSRPDPYQQGLQQLDQYLAGLRIPPSEQPVGWLVIFDQRSNQPTISERTTADVETSPQGRSVYVIRA